MSTSYIGNLQEFTVFRLDILECHLAVFKHLLSIIAPSIQKQETKMRKPISPAERLVLTLRYLVTNEALHSDWGKLQLATSY